MAKNYTGIIAGIGDKSEGINLISPQFDARIRYFIIGNSNGGVIDGLELKDGILSSGLAYAKGYIGELKESISLSDINVKSIWCKFTIYHDTTKPDIFSVYVYEDGDTEETSQQDDILHSPGSFSLKIYDSQSGNATKLSYPSFAEYSLNTDVVLPNGVLYPGTTCTTQLVNDNSTKVASTEYVHNQIVEEIGYKAATIDISSNTSSANYYLYFTRKANNVVITQNIDVVSGVSMKEFTIPEEFIPTSTKDLVLGVKSTYYKMMYFYKLTINAEGNVTITSLSGGVSFDTLPSYDEFSLGYSLN